MGTPRINTRPLLTMHVVSQRIFSDDNFCLLDVGASGGIDQHWSAFTPDLIAFGFEPLISEVERLNRECKNPKIKYHSCFVGSKEIMMPEKEPEYKKNNIFQRTSAARASSIMSIDYAKDYYDPTGNKEISSEHIALDDFVNDNEISDVDFIKTDTDGFDYYALHGAKDILSEKVLGVFVEFDFHGRSHDNDNMFYNIDMFLRDKGFSLFDMEVYRYSKAVMPKPFVYKIPAQTHGGQVLWGDALYIRDILLSDDGKARKLNLSPIKLLKLACIFEIYGLEDCAAELIISHRDMLAKIIEIDHCLNLLTPLFRGKQLSYKAYNNLFEHNTEAFYPMESFADRIASRVIRIPLIGFLSAKLYRTLKAIIK